MKKRCPTPITFQAMVYTWCTLKRADSDHYNLWLMIQVNFVVKQVKQANQNMDVCQVQQIVGFAQLTAVAEANEMVHKCFQCTSKQT